MADDNTQWYEAFAGTDDTTRDGNIEVLQGYKDEAAFGAAFFEQSAAAKEAKDANWRAPFADGDDKAAKMFERYLTPADLGKSLVEKEALIRASTMLKPLAEDHNDDDLKAYREQQGVPAQTSSRPCHRHQRKAPANSRP